MGQFKQLQFIYYALIAGQVLFCAIVVFVLQPQPAEELLISYIAGAMLFSMIGISFKLYDMRKVQGAELRSVQEKFEHYRASNIIRWAMIEGSVLFCIVSILLEGATMMLAMVVLGLLVFYLYRPSLEGFAEDYKVAREEAMTIE